MNNNNSKKIVILIISFLNLVYSIITMFLPDGPHDSFFEVPFGVPLVLATILLFTSAYSLSWEGKKYVSIVSLCINLLVILFPVLMIVFI